MKSWYNLFLVITLFVSQAFFSQATFTSIADGNWNATGTWTLTSGTDADGIPDADDAVIIKAHTVTVNVNAACASLTTDDTSPKLNVNEGVLLSINGDFLVNSNNTRDNITTIIGKGTISSASLTVGYKYITPIQTSFYTTLIYNTEGVFNISGDINIYSSVNGSVYNTGTLYHDSGTIAVSGKMISTQQSTGTTTKYIADGSRAGNGILIFKSKNTGAPVVLTTGVSSTQLSPDFTNCTVVYSPTLSGVQIFNTKYKNLKIDSDYSISTPSFTINENGNLYLTKGNLTINSNYLFAGNNVTIIRSGGSISKAPSFSGGTFYYNINYTQNNSTITAGAEMIASSTQLEALTIGTTNGVIINKTCTPKQLNINSNTTLSGSGIIKVRNLLNIPEVITLNTGNIITLVSNFENTARVSTLMDNTNIIGNVTIERFLKNVRREWRLLTTPLKGSVMNTVFNNWQNNGNYDDGYGTDIWGPYGNPDSNGLQYLNNSSHNLRNFNNTTSTWTNVSNSFEETLFDENINKAFLCFFTHPYGMGTDGNGNAITESLPTTLKSTGNLITGDVVYNIPSSGFYIVGNPYASPIDFNTILSDPSNTGISKKIWFIDPTLGKYGTYTTWDSINGYSNISSSRYPSTVIQSGEAFFIKSKSGASTLTIKETHKTAQNNNNVINRKSNINTIERIRVMLDKEENSTWNYNIDAIVAGFYSSGNSAYDNNDVQKLSNPSETLSFVTDNFSLSSEHRAPIQDNDFLTVKIAQTTANTNYKLKIFTENFTYTGQAYLEDIYLNKSTPIALDGSTFEYAFQVTTDPLSTGNRFKIKFSTSTLGATTPTATPFVIYPNPTTAEKGINISFESSSSSGYHYKLFNPAGQLIEADALSVNNKLGHIAFNSHLKTGVYYINLYDQNNELKNSQTIIIQ